MPTDNECLATAAWFRASRLIEVAHDYRGRLENGRAPEFPHIICGAVLRRDSREAIDQWFALCERLMRGAAAPKWRS